MAAKGGAVVVALAFLGTVPASDRDGNQRPFESGVDMGAYERLPSQEVKTSSARDQESARGASGGRKDAPPAVKEAVPRDRIGPPFQVGGRGGPFQGFGWVGSGPIPTERKLVVEFDSDGDGRLNKDERLAAREKMRKEREQYRGPGIGFGFGFRPGPGGLQFGSEGRQPPQPGPKVTPAEVKSYPDADLYDPAVLRTFFLDFENADWEKELADFIHTDVDVPAVLTVDGRRYEGVGVHFRGSSSLFMVSEGWKRSLSLSLDHVDPSQRLHGYKALDLLNSHGDPTFLRSFLYCHIARHYLPAPKANFVKVVINGQSWGIYVSQEQFDKDFLKEWFGTKEGYRWKVGADSRRGRGFSYLGDDPEDYKWQYELKTRNGEKAWPDLINLCRTLNQAPAECLEDALSPLFDIDRALWFLALDNVLINNDGYWIRTGDYNLYEDRHGRFHVLPHDANETFEQWGGGGFAFGRAPDAAGINLDPLLGAQDPDMPLLSRLLAAPGLKARYLAHVRTIAEEWLDWGKLGPLLEKQQSLLAEEVRSDTRKLDSFTAFEKGVAEGSDEGSFGGPRRVWSLKRFIEERRNYLLGHPEVAKRVPRIASLGLQVLRNGSALPGDPTSQEPVRVIAEAAMDFPPERVLLYYAAGKEATFECIEMANVGEGRYVEKIPPMPAGTEVRYYVEARSTSSEAASFLPARAELGALSYKVKRE